jgi:hypothetical protein
MDQGSDGAVAGDQGDRERGSPDGCILTLAVNSSFDLVVDLSERIIRVRGLHLRPGEFEPRLLATSRDPPASRTGLRQPARRAGDPDQEKECES